jgi:hypothetical protein
MISLNRTLATVTAADYVLFLIDKHTIVRKFAQIDIFLIKTKETDGT